MGNPPVKIPVIHFRSYGPKGGSLETNPVNVVATPLGGNTSQFFQPMWQIRPQTGNILSTFSANVSATPPWGNTLICFVITWGSYGNSTIGEILCNKFLSAVETPY